MHSIHATLACKKHIRRHTVSRYRSCCLEQKVHVNAKLVWLPPLGRHIDMCAHNSVRAWACCTEVAGGNRGQPRGARRGSNSGRCGCNRRPCLNHCAALSFVRGRWDAATLSSNQCHAKLCSGTRPLAPCEGLFRRAMVAQTSRWLPVALPVQPHADIPTTMTAAPGVQQWRGAAR